MLRYLFVLCLAVLALGCNPSGLFSDGILDDEIVVINAADRAIAIVAIEKERSYLIDPMPALPATAFAARKVEPGAQRVLTGIDGYMPGDDLYVIVYAESDDPLPLQAAVVAGSDGAPWRTAFTVTALDLERQRNRIAIHL